MSPESSPRPLKRDYAAFDQSYSQWNSQLPELDQPFSVPDQPFSVPAEPEREEASAHQAFSVPAENRSTEAEPQPRNEQPSQLPLAAPAEARPILKAEPESRTADFSKPPASVPQYQPIIKPEPEFADLPNPSLIPTEFTVGMKREASPARSSTGELTDAGPNTPSRGTTPIAGIPPFSTPNSSAFAALNGNGSGPPPAKRPKLSFQEKEMKRINKEIKDKERAEEKAKKDAERQAQAEERARKEAEKEAEKKRKEAERQALAEEKARKEAEKEADKKRKEAEREQKRVALEAEKAAKEERRKKKEEEKLRKEKGQMKLNNFFAMPATPAQPRNRSGSVESRGRSSKSPAPQSTTVNTAGSSPAKKNPSKNTPSKHEQPEMVILNYDQMFPPFFIQTGVTLAPINRFERDAEGSKAVEATIDSYILGDRSPGKERPFDATSLFHIPEQNTKPRGLRRMPVREIMNEFTNRLYSGQASKPIDLTTDSQNSQIKRTTGLLQRIPMKFLGFQEDVRPPYRGTYTARPVNGFAKLARNPMRKDLPDMNYDYDSEADWVEDDDAEDLKSEDEEEELDEDEDMEGFLDDEGDETSHSKRLVLQGDLEPISTGMCWEDRTKRNTNVKMVAYRMEIILDPTIKSIDPFSTSYWEPQTNPMDPPRIPLNNMRNTSLNFNAKPAKSFFSSASDVLKSAASPQAQAANTKTKTSKPKDSKPRELLPSDKMEAFKQEVQGNELSKVGLVEVLKLKFKGHTAGTIKATLDAIAMKGAGKNSKWVLREDSEIATRMS